MLNSIYFDLKIMDCPGKWRSLPRPDDQCLLDYFHVTRWPSKPHGGNRETKYLAVIRIDSNVKYEKSISARTEPCYKLSFNRILPSLKNRSTSELYLTFVVGVPCKKQKPETREPELEWGESHPPPSPSDTTLWCHWHCAGVINCTAVLCI